MTKSTPRRKNCATSCTDFSAYHTTNSVRSYRIEHDTNKPAHLLQEPKHVSILIRVHEFELLQDESCRFLALKSSHLELPRVSRSGSEDTRDRSGILVVQAYRMFALCNPVDMSSLLLQSHLPSHPCVSSVQTCMIKSIALTIRSAYSTSTTSFARSVMSEWTRSSSVIRWSIFARTDFST